MKIASHRISVVACSTFCMFLIYYDFVDHPQSNSRVGVKRHNCPSSARCYLDSIKDVATYIDQNLYTPTWYQF